ncbi:MAG TPA: CocE/NonD family hydrolase [Streptosporangiaceae bacterium]|nr:CocE/NonD family hydrolase [Streptosporangiaceae bacterium]
MRQSTDRRTPRPVAPAAAALTKMLSRAWSLPPQRNFVAVERNVQVPMSDGTVLLADHYLPITSQPAATVLVRCPYGRGAPFSLLQAQLVAERGFHVLLQSCRGTFGSGGQFEPMRREASDGQDTVAWLRGQSWFDGRLATFGPSYLGFVQWALALDPPPELVAAVVVVGPHDFSRTAYRNGAFDLYNFLSWSDLIVHQERVNPVSGMVRTVTADRRLRRALDRAPLAEGARDLLGTGAPWFETWLEHPQLTDPFWAPLQCGAALERISVPTLLIGGWQDLFLEQTIEQFGVLAERGVPTRMLIGPWTHVDTATKAGPAFVEGLAWLERHAGQVPGEPATGHSVRYWVGGAREWREMATWPPDGQTPQRWYLGPDGALSPKEPPDGTPATFRYDPADPTPSVGGAILALNAGVRDNRAVEQRPDVLVFTSEPLGEPIEVIGDVTAELHVTRDNPNADLFVRLCDVDPPGDAKSRSRNVCDGIVRLTDADPLSGTVRVSLIGAAHRFGRGHRLRLQVAGGAHPRFARNPGNGQVDAPAKDFVVTHYSVQSPSALVVSQTAGKAAAHA